MSDANPKPTGPSAPKVPEHVAAGVYATGMINTHTHEEFVLDFLASFAPPARVVARVIVHPAHAKRLAAALRENIARYEKQFGPILEAGKAETARTKPAGDFYSSCAIPDAVLAGQYATGALVAHTPEEFILDFIVGFPPTPVVTARVLVSPRHVRRIANALEARLRMYEESFGPLPEQPPPAPPSPFKFPESDEPPPFRFRMD
jgi:hypothetical protein